MKSINFIFSLCLSLLTVSPAISAEKKFSNSKENFKKFELGRKTSAVKSQMRENSEPKLNKESSYVDIPTIYGSVVYSDKIAEEKAEIGLYELSKNGGSPLLLFEKPDALFGGAYSNGIYYATTYGEYFGYGFIDTYAYDINTGKPVAYWEPFTADVLAPGGYAADPVDGKIYGLTYNKNQTGYQLSLIEFGEEVIVTEIAPMADYWNCIAFDGNGQLYGISYTVEGNDSDAKISGCFLYKIDKSTGATTMVSQVTGAPVPAYISGACIEPDTGRMFWNICPADEKSYLYEVNLETAEAKLLYELPDNDEICGMFVPDIELSNLPAPTGLQAEVVTKGIRLTWQLPESGDEPLPLGYNIYRDGYKINVFMVESDEYLDTDVKDGQEYVYWITAVYDNEESRGSSPVEIKFSGIFDLTSEKIIIKAENGNMVICGGEGLNVIVSTITGVIIYNGSCSETLHIPADKGIYLVKVGEKVRVIRF